jgi:choline dehydrogenase-like flavoprotein
MRSLQADVVIIGSGMGGGTTAHALAKRGVDVLVLERGRRLPREPENWSPRAVFVERRYKPDERWLDGAGRRFAPGVHYVVGGNTKVYGASLPRFREWDFEAVEHEDGISPAWPFRYADLEPYYGEAERMYGVHGTTGEDPTEPWRSTPFPYPALEHEPYIAELAERLRAQGVSPSSNAMGVDRREGGLCILCGTCDGFPCKLGAKSDAETCGIEPALATGNARLEPGVRVQRIVGNGRRVDHLLAEDSAGAELKVTAAKFVLAAGAVNSAALLLRSDLANSSGLVGRNFMMHNNAHIVAVDLNRRNDVTFQKTLSVNDWYFDGGDGHPLGALQLIGKVRGAMMKTAAPRGVPAALLNRVAQRSVEWLIMAEDLPDHANRVTVDAAGTITTARIARGVHTHERLLARAKRLLRRDPHPALRHQHEQPPVRNRRRRCRSGNKRARPVVPGARPRQPLGDRRRLLSILCGDEPRADDRGSGAARRRRVRLTLVVRYRL